MKKWREDPIPNSNLWRFHPNWSNTFSLGKGGGNAQDLSWRPWGETWLDLPTPRIKMQQKSREKPGPDRTITTYSDRHVFAWTCHLFCVSRWIFLFIFLSVALSHSHIYSLMSFLLCFSLFSIIGTFWVLVKKKKEGGGPCQVWPWRLDFGLVKGVWVTRIEGRWVGWTCRSGVGLVNPKRKGSLVEKQYGLGNKLWTGFSHNPKFIWLENQSKFR